MSQNPATAEGWYFVIPESSPMLRYQPYADGGPAGWNSTGDNHISSAQSASVALDFYGDGLQLIGFRNASCTVQIDDGDPLSIPVPNDRASVSGGFFNTRNLALGAHTAVVTVTSNDPELVLAINQAVVYNSKNDDILNQTPVLVDCLDPLVAYGGRQGVIWDVVKDPTFALNERQQYHRADGQDLYYTFNFTGSRAFSLHSSLTDMHGRTQISVNDEKVELENYRKYQVNRALRFFKDGLDEEQEYVVTVKTLSEARLTLTEARLYGTKVAVGGKLFFNDPNTAPSNSGSSAGAIAGGVVGGLVAGLLIALGVFFIFRKRQQHKSKRVPIEEYSEPIEATPFPYEATRFTHDSTNFQGHLQPKRLGDGDLPSPLPNTPTSVPATSSTGPNRNMDLETALGVLVRSIDRPLPAEPLQSPDEPESPPQYRHQR